MLPAQRPAALPGTATGAIPVMRNNRRLAARAEQRVPSPHPPGDGRFDAPSNPNLADFVGAVPDDTAPSGPYSGIVPSGALLEPAPVIK